MLGISFAIAVALSKGHEPNPMADAIIAEAQGKSQPAAFSLPFPPGSFQPATSELGRHGRRVEALSRQPGRLDPDHPVPAAGSLPEFPCISFELTEESSAQAIV
jgi:hypothetical protein